MKTYSPHKYSGHCFLLSAFILMVFACAAQNTNNGIELSIQRIENNIIRLNSSGEEKGKPQSLLSRMESLHIPGVSIAVFNNGNIQWAKGYGFSDTNAGTLVDTSTIFQAASISKSLTAVAMFALVEKNMVQLDIDINQQLNDWQLPVNEYTTAEKATPKRIAAHMAGLSVHGFTGYHQKDKIPTLLQVLDGIPPANSKPIRVIEKPGTKMMYSGGGYTILQLLLQEKAGRPFPELMDEWVLRPAAMAKSTFALHLPDSILQHLAKGYLSNGSMVAGGYNIYPEQAAAGLWTTPCDLARFMINVGNSYRSGKGILQQSSVQTMFTKIPGGNGVGFGIDGEANTMRFAHLGSNVGFYCYAVSFAGVGRGVVIMTNSDNGFQLIKEIAKAVTKEYQWKN